VSRKEEISNFLLSLKKDSDRLQDIVRLERKIRGNGSIRRQLPEEGEN